MMARINFTVRVFLLGSSPAIYKGISLMNSTHDNAAIIARLFCTARDGLRTIDILLSKTLDNCLSTTTEYIRFTKKINYALVPQLTYFLPKVKSELYSAGLFRAHNA